MRSALGRLALGIGLALALGAIARAAPASRAVDRSVQKLIRKARSLLEQLEYEQSGRLLESAVRTRRYQKARPSTKALLFATLGQTRAELGDGVGADEAFTMAVRFSRRVRLPAHTSPKILAALERARKRLPPPAATRGAGTDRVSMRSPQATPAASYERFGEAELQPPAGSAKLRPDSTAGGESSGRGGASDAAKRLEAVAAKRTGASDSTEAISLLPWEGGETTAAAHGAVPRTRPADTPTAGGPPTSPKDDAQSDAPGVRPKATLAREPSAESKGASAHARATSGGPEEASAQTGVASVRTEGASTQPKPTSVGTGTETAAQAKAKAASVGTVGGSTRLGATSIGSKAVPAQAKTPSAGTERASDRPKATSVATAGASTHPKATSAGTEGASNRPKAASVGTEGASRPKATSVEAEGASTQPKATSVEPAAVAAGATATSVRPDEPSTEADGTSGTVGRASIGPTGPPAGSPAQTGAPLAMGVSSAGGEADTDGIMSKRASASAGAEPPTIREAWSAPQPPTLLPAPPPVYRTTTSTGATAAGRPVGPHTLASRGFSGPEVAAIAISSAIFVAGVTALVIVLASRTGGCEALPGSGCIDVEVLPSLRF